jgi:integrase
MASIEKRKGPRGVRYDVRYRAPDGSERSKTFRTRREADGYASTCEADKLRGGWIDPRLAARTLRSVAEEWLASNVSKRPSAWARDESALRVHVLPALGDRTLGSLVPADVRKLVAHWSATLAPRTVKRNFGALRALCNFAVATDLLLVSPCRGVKTPMPDTLTRHVVTSDELRVLGQAIGPEWEPIVYLGTALGLRWGECAGLRVGRLDLLASRLAVTEQLTRGPKGVGVLGPPKSSAGRRTLALPAGLVLMLSDHLSKVGLTGADSESFVFTMPGGEPLRYENWRRRVWLPAVAKAGLGGLTFHDLRRANATALVSEGVDLKTAQTRLGHSDPRLTLAVYAQATTEADRDAAHRLDGRFFGTPAGYSRDDSAKPASRTALQAVRPALTWSGRRDLNPGPQRPERCALTKLRHAPREVAV